MNKKVVITIIVVTLLASKGGILIAKQQNQATDGKMQQNKTMIQKPSSTIKMDATGTPGTMKDEITGMQEKQDNSITDQ